MRSCSTCSGFVPDHLQGCPHCGATGRWRRLVGALASVIGAGAAMATLAACYGLPPQIDTCVDTDGDGWLPGCYDDMIVRRTHEDEWHAAARERIESQTAGLRADNPEVEVDVRVVHDQPAHALREASKDADLLLVGRHADSGVRHLGSTARALLREATCPVEVVPTRLVGTADQELRLERAGAPLK